MRIIRLIAWDNRISLALFRPRINIVGELHHLLRRFHLLADLVSNNDKHNVENGVDDCDGANDNKSWNRGAEGLTDDAAILALRRRQVRNALTMLFVSQGVPMLSE